MEETITIGPRTPLLGILGLVYIIIKRTKIMEICNFQKKPKTMLKLCDRALESGHVTINAKMLPF